MDRLENSIDFWEGQYMEIHTVEGNIFSAQLIKNDNNGLLYLTSPFHFTFIEEKDSVNGASVKIYFHDNKRGLCTFKTNIQKIRNRLAIPFPKSDIIKKVENRKFFRVPAMVELSIKLQPSTFRNNDPLYTLDLSGGGLSFLCPYSIEKGELIEGSLLLKTDNSKKDIAFNGKIVNVHKSPHGKQYKISIEFVDMKESVRTAIIQFCMLKQAQLRKKLRNY